MRVLDPSKNRIDENSARDLANAIRQMARLVELRLMRTGKGRNASRTDSVGRRSTSRDSRLGRIGIGKKTKKDDDMPWYQGFKSLKSLKELNLSGNKLGPDGARDLSDLFEYVELERSDKTGLECERFLLEGAKILTPTMRTRFRVGILDTSELGLELSNPVDSFQRTGNISESLRKQIRGRVRNIYVISTRSGYAVMLMRSDVEFEKDEAGSEYGDDAILHARIIFTFVVLLGNFVLRSVSSSSTTRFSKVL